MPTTPRIYLYAILAFAVVSNATVVRGVASLASSLLAWDTVGDSGFLTPSGLAVHGVLMAVVMSALARRLGD